ncbi:MAG: hypothetical protein WA364_21805 [Candidatus Nitrosopolaris sp.]
MNESRMCTKQSLRGSKRHRLTRWSEQQNIREDKTIGRLLHRRRNGYIGEETLKSVHGLVSSGKISSCTAKNKNYDSDYSDNGQKVYMCTSNCK